MQVMSLGIDNIVNYENKISIKVYMPDLKLYISF